MTTIHTRQLQQYTQDNYNNTHKTTNNNTHKTTTTMQCPHSTTNTHKMTTIHTRKLRQYTQDNYNNTHKTTTTIHTKQPTIIHTRQLQQYNAHTVQQIHIRWQQYTQDNYNNTWWKRDNIVAQCLKFPWKSSCPSDWRMGEQYRNIHSWEVRNVTAIEQLKQQHRIWLE